MNSIIALLRNEIISAKRAAQYLDYSLKKTSHFVLNDSYNEEDLESIEALTARFERLSDIIVQKLLKSIDLYDQEVSRTVRERLLNAEKKGIIENHDQFLEIRILRNTIAHDYTDEHFGQVLKSVRIYAPILLHTLQKIEAYIESQ